MKGKRTWWFLQSPPYFQIKCNKCGENNKLQWSEFKSHVWCETCNDDISDYLSPMNGPTPINLASMLMDLRVVDAETKQVYHYIEYHKINKLISLPFPKKLYKFRYI